MDAIEVRKKMKGRMGISMELKINLTDLKGNLRFQKVLRNSGSINTQGTFPTQKCDGMVHLHL